MTSALYILLMGVQGAGKGTQAPKLVEKYGVVWVTTGDMFRAMKNQDTPLAHKIQEIMNRGDLIPDDLTIQVVRDRLSKPDAAKGIVFDGFPRTPPQAEALDEMLKDLGSKVNLVLFLNLDREKAISRISGRWQCAKGHIYNLSTNPPKQSGVCDIDGLPLTHRADDTTDGATRRIDTFFKDTMPLLDYYRAKGVLAEIDADQPIDKVTTDLIAAVDMANKKA